MEELSVEMFASWRQHPITRALFAAMEVATEAAKTRWLNGHFTDESNASATFLIQAREQERARVYRALMEMSSVEFFDFLGIEGE